MSVNVEYKNFAFRKQFKPGSFQDDLGCYSQAKGFHLA